MSAERQCAEQFAVTHPDKAAAVLEEAPEIEVAAFLEELPAATAAELIGMMSPAVGAGCLGQIRPESVAVILEAMAVDVAARLLRRVAPGRLELTLGACGEPRQTLLRRLLTYPEGTVGSRTDPKVLALTDDLSVAQAVKQIRREGGELHHHVFVLDRSHRVLGVVHVRDLLRAEDSDRLTDLMQFASSQLPASSRLRDVIDHPAWRRVDALPVLDDAQRLLGILRHRDVREVEPAIGSGPVVNTLVNLGELYWLGLTSVLSGPATGEQGRRVQPARGDE